MRLEHANLSVRDADAMTRFLQVIAPDFRVRGEGLDAQGRPWRHVGNDEFYIALQTVMEGDTRTPYGDTPGLNHLGWEVESVNASLKSACGMLASCRIYVSRIIQPGHVCTSMIPKAMTGSSSNT